MWAPLKELSLSPCMVPFVGAAPNPGGLTGTHPLHLITSLNTLSLSLPPSHLPSCGPSKEPALGLLPSLCNEGAVTWQGPHRSQVAASPPHSERAFTVLWLSVKSSRFCNLLNLRVKHVLIQKWWAGSFRQEDLPCVVFGGGLSPSPPRLQEGCSRAGWGDRVKEA